MGCKWCKKRAYAVHRAAIVIIKICRENAVIYKNRFWLHGMVIEPLAEWLEYEV